MPKLLNSPIKLQALAAELRESNNISIIGGSDKELANRNFDLARIDSLKDRSLLGNVADLTSVGKQIWSEAWADAYAMFQTLLEANKEVIPQNVFNVLVLEPKLGLNFDQYGSASDIEFRIHAFQFEKLFTEYQSKIDARTDGKIKQIAKNPDFEKQKTAIMSEAIEDIVNFKKLHLTLTALHELFHLIERKVFVTSSPAEKSTEAPASNTEKSPEITTEDGRKIKRHIYGFQITVNSQNRSMGEALSETMTSLAELICLRKKGYHPDPSFSFSINLNELKMEAEDLARFRSVCTTAGLQIDDKDVIKTPSLSLTLPKFGSSNVSLCYRRITRHILELSQEIFADEVHKSQDPYATTFKKLLEASTRGKVSRFFKDAQFEGLEQIAPDERKLTHNQYVRFIMGFGAHPSNRDAILLHAFIRAGSCLSGLDAVRARKDIMDLKKELDKRKT